MSPLFSAAQTARMHAYAIYSGYLVGAAVEDEHGRVHAGCNVENLSYGATICAERNAILQMVATGGRTIRRMAIVTADGGLPCALCLQVMREFADDFSLEIYAGESLVRTVRFRELLPESFQSDAVHRT